MKSIKEQQEEALKSIDNIIAKNKALIAPGMDKLSEEQRMFFNNALNNIETLDINKFTQEVQDRWGKK